VKYLNGHKQGRSNTIAKVKKIINGEIEYKNNWVYANGPNEQNIQLEVIFDDRKNLLKPKLYEIAWLPTHTNGTVWIHNPPPTKAKKVKATLDKFNREIEPGALCTFAVNMYGSQVSVFVGSVTKISERGVIYCKSICVRDGEPEVEFRISDNSSIILLTQDLMDQITLARLSAQQ
jgi:hypothetical protein